MGKGDIKSKKGKIANGSYGNRRPQEKPKVEIAAKPARVAKEKPPKTEKPKAKAKK
ncbi:30S ribosomal protein THX [Sphingobacterium sp. SRCM116780]|uniref:30S ribosomal protein THX n=1 Tax=Sphingobacterium sp. SRCM116780 TaxID=2907623 RepID=UPI001F1D8C5B|nr:30S ribosomal protein THX [Sphingobacterium sp. SRCM116780]UIR57227.1 30S ribosomal protein THX [Sphingobacterium sp. SRCM116780]